MNCYFKEQGAGLQSLNVSENNVGTKVSVFVLSFLVNPGAKAVTLTGGVALKTDIGQNHKQYPGSGAELGSWQRQLARAAQNVSLFLFLSGKWETQRRDRLAFVQHKPNYSPQ